MENTLYTLSFWDSGWVLEDMYGSRFAGYINYREVAE